MAQQTRRQISLTVGHAPILNEERVANEAITPGHLTMVSSGKIIKNTANAANVARAFALERDEMGKDIDTAYAVGDVVKVGLFRPGQRVYAFLASGQNVLDGAYLTGDNAGLLTATGVTAQLRLGRAVEDCDATGGPTAGKRIRVEIV